MTKIDISETLVRDKNYGDSLLKKILWVWVNRPQTKRKSHLKNDSMPPSG